LFYYIIYSIKIVEAWLLLGLGIFIDMCLLLNIKFVEVGLYNKSYKNIKFNIVTCMKVTGEAFSFHHKRKGAEEARY